MTPTRRKEILNNLDAELRKALPENGRAVHALLRWVETHVMDGLLLDIADLKDALMNDAQIEAELRVKLALRSERIRELESFLAGDMPKLQRPKGGS